MTREAVTRARCVVLDLDGPVASVFAGEPAAVAAAELVGLARRDGRLVETVRHSADPIAVLSAHTRALHAHGADPGWRRTVAAMHDLLDDYERKAAETAVPTPGAAAFIEACHASGRTLAVATNNHAEAAARILERMGVLHCFPEGAVVGRSGDAREMKPSPVPLLRAMRPGVGPGGHLMIGDTVTDYRAARQVGMPFCGYHAQGAGRQRLSAAGAPLVVARMAELSVFG